VDNTRPSAENLSHSLDRKVRKAIRKGNREPTIALVGGGGGARQSASITIGVIAYSQIYNDPKGKGQDEQGEDSFRQSIGISDPNSH
jgi:hypothetical protein